MTNDELRQEIQRALALDASTAGVPAATRERAAQWAAKKYSANKASIEKGFMAAVVLTQRAAEAAKVALAALRPEHLEAHMPLTGVKIGSKEKRIKQPKRASPGCESLHEAYRRARAELNS